MLLLPAEYGMCLVSFNSSLYLVGGWTTLAERFDPDTEEWIPLASMEERRRVRGGDHAGLCERHWGLFLLQRDLSAEHGEM